jgi:hypothetical protein
MSICSPRWLSSFELDEIGIAVEEAVAVGYIQRANSAYIKPTIQLAGSFFGGLLGY